MIKVGPDRRRPYCRTWLVAAANGRRGWQEAGDEDGRCQPPSSVEVVLVVEGNYAIRKQRQRRCATGARESVTTRRDNGHRIATAQP